MSGIYHHTCTVERVVETENEWGEITQGWKEVYSDVKCHLSAKILRPSDTNAVTSSRNDYKLFLPLNYTIYQGDKITALVEGFKHSFLANEPARYKLLKKQEIVLSEVSE